MPEYIKVKRAGHTFRVKRELTEQERKDRWYSRRQKTITETVDTVDAKVISPRLAMFQYEKATIYNDSRYHIIHIPTGLVIADITYDLMSDVKKKPLNQVNGHLKREVRIHFVYSKMDLSLK